MGMVISGGKVGVFCGGLDSQSLEDGLLPPSTSPSLDAWDLEVD